MYEVFIGEQAGFIPAFSRKEFLVAILYTGKMLLFISYCLYNKKIIILKKIKITNLLNVYVHSCLERRGILEKL